LVADASTTDLAAGAFLVAAAVLTAVFALALAGTAFVGLDLREAGAAAVVDLRVAMESPSGLLNGINSIRR
jgi:hypothetical protein